METPPAIGWEPAPKVTHMESVTRTLGVEAGPVDSGSRNLVSKSSPGCRGKLNRASVKTQAGEESSH